MCAMWQPTRFTVKTAENSFARGVNTFVTPFEVDDSELTDVYNMTSDDTPAISVRDGRANFASTAATTNLNGLGKRNNAVLHFVDGNTWKYWDTASTAYINVSTSLTSTGKGEFAEFATGTALYTLYLNGTDRLRWDGTTSVPTSLTTNCPASNLVTTHSGRIYVAKDKTLSFSALQKSTDWTTANDSGAITVTNAQGNLTAVIEYANHIVAFTETSMHELYGTGPANYQLQNLTDEIGCIANRTVQEVKGLLLWLGYNGIFKYTGGIPSKISNPVKRWIDGINYTYKTGACAGVMEDKYYISIPYGTSATGNNTLLVYDTLRNSWMVEDSTVIAFVNIANVLYGLQSNGQIRNMKTGTLDGASDISWSFITKCFNDNSIENKKVLKDLTVVFSRSSTSTMNLSFSTGASSTSFTTLATSSDFSSTGLETVARLKIPLTALQNEEFYRLKFDGTGPATIHSIQRNIRVKKVTD